MFVNTCLYAYAIEILIVLKIAVQKLRKIRLNKTYITKFPIDQSIYEAPSLQKSSKLPSHDYIQLFKFFFCPEYNRYID